MATAARRTLNPAVLHEDNMGNDGDSTEEDRGEMEESEGPADESRCTVSDEEPDEPDEGVLEEMARFEQSFKNINQRYRLMNRIGEGTFSTVYKAEDLYYEHYQNDWDLDAHKENDSGVTNAQKPSNRPQRPRYVAIKKIYVTSSPSRILNELELLYDLRDSPNVCPLITAFRHQDQVIAILPYFQHQDFRDYYRDLSVPDMKVYFESLFTAMKFVHEAEIIHRDIKPTNFLYSPAQRRGVLVDFGLAERQGTDYHPCACTLDPKDRQRKIKSSAYAAAYLASHAAGQSMPPPTYPKEDSRSSKRANRAGTRGFRAPEVLLKCTAQTCQIDIWSCGIILLTFLSKRFPFFASQDDIDAFIELSTIFGKKKMRDTAFLHGQVLHTNISTISDGGHTWEKILMWCNGRDKKALDSGLSSEEWDAVDFMSCCLELDPSKRIPAEEALKHPFLDVAEIDSQGAATVE